VTALFTEGIVAILAGLVLASIWARGQRGAHVPQRQDTF